MIIALILISIASFAQKDSTSVDSVKIKKKEWKIELNDKQKAAMTNFDLTTERLQQQFQMQYNAIIEQKNVYLKAILEGKEIDITKVHDFKYDKGVLTFIEDLVKK